VNVSCGTGNAVPIEPFGAIELRRSLACLVAAMNATDREKLGAHLAYEEALHLFRVLRPHMCRTAALRLAIRIKKTDRDFTAFSSSSSVG